MGACIVNHYVKSQQRTTDDDERNLHVNWPKLRKYLKSDTNLIKKCFNYSVDIIVITVCNNLQ
jgi:hypothetical protein